MFASDIASLGNGEDTPTDSVASSDPWQVTWSLARSHSQCTMRAAENARRCRFSMIRSCDSVSR